AQAQPLLQVVVELADGDAGHVISGSPDGAIARLPRDCVIRVGRCYLQGRPGLRDERVADAPSLHPGYKIPYDCIAINAITPAGRPPRPTAPRSPRAPRPSIDCGAPRRGRCRRRWRGPAPGRRG